MAKDNNSVDQFMLAEFQTITSRVLNIEQTRSTRVNYYIVLVTAIFGSLIFLLQNQQMNSVILTLALLLSFFCFVLGFAVLNEYIDLAAQVVLLYRRAGRIRCWFYDKNPKILPYLPWMPGDDTPPFRDDPGFATFAGRDAILYLGNSVSGAVFGYFILDKVGVPSFYVSLISSIAFFMFLWVTQNYYLKRKISQYERIGERENSIHFPKDDRVPVSDVERVLVK